MGAFSDEFLSVFLKRKQNSSVKRELNLNREEIFNHVGTKGLRSFQVQMNGMTEEGKNLQM